MPCPSTSSDSYTLLWKGVETQGLSAPSYLPLGNALRKDSACGFLGGWQQVVDPEDDEWIFAMLEHRLNQSGATSLRLPVRSGSRAVDRLKMTLQQPWP
jgi:hypothetical protein